MKDVLFYRLAANEMFGEDAIHHRLGDLVIPDTLGVHSHNRPALTNPQAFGQRTFNSFWVTQLAQIAQAGGQMVVKALGRFRRPAIAVGTN